MAKPPVRLIPKTRSQAKPKSRKSVRRKTSVSEPDGVYFLKIFLYLLIATFWLRLTNINISIFTDLGVPAGAVVGLIIARRETNLTDRKIIYALLLAGAVLSFYLPVGVQL